MKRSRVSKPLLSTSEVHRLGLEQESSRAIRAIGLAVLNKKNVSPFTWQTVDKQQRALNRAKKTIEREPGPGDYKVATKSPVIGVIKFRQVDIPANKQHIRFPVPNPGGSDPPLVSSFGTQVLSAYTTAPASTLVKRGKSLLSRDVITSDVEYPPIQSSLGRQIESNCKSMATVHFNRAKRFL